MLNVETHKFNACILLDRDIKKEAYEEALRRLPRNSTACMHDFFGIPCGGFEMVL